MFATTYVDAASPPPAVTSRFQLSGSGTLERGAAATVQSANGLQLTARLQVSAKTWTPRSAGGFALAARLAATPLGCSSDTIFANGFD
ncbi:MAG TPA: hypothetical protein VFG55_05430 [Rhodanobacteraceae bacterium]|nr:hypothetical protein [Rhodanobacteraceae bacterium]